MEGIGPLVNATRATENGHPQMYLPSFRERRDSAAFLALAASAEGGALTGLGQYAEAEALLLHSDEVLREEGTAQQLLMEQNQERLAKLYAVWNR